MKQIRQPRHSKLMNAEIAIRMFGFCQQLDVPIAVYVWAEKHYRRISAYEVDVTGTYFWIHFADGTNNCMITSIDQVAVVPITPDMRVIYRAD